MLTKAVFATSLSEVSDKVLGCLGGLKKLGVQDLTLAHALPPPYCRSANRYSAPPDRRAPDFGFRVVLAESQPLIPHRK